MQFTISEARSALSGGAKSTGTTCKCILECKDGELPFSFRVPAAIVCQDGEGEMEALYRVLRSEAIKDKIIAVSTPKVTAVQKKLSVTFAVKDSYSPRSFADQLERWVSEDGLTSKERELRAVSVADQANAKADATPVETAKAEEATPVSEPSKPGRKGKATPATV